MTTIEAKVIAAWREAALDLGITFTSPFVATFPDGRRIECLGLVHHFGRHEGTLISVIGEPSARSQYPCDDDYYTSELGTGYCHYDRAAFVETLNDWGYFRADASRHPWYSPAAHWGGSGPALRFA